MFAKFIPMLALAAIPAAPAAAPTLMLAQEYQNQNIQGWAMSEKLDGVRAYWDGKQLISRQGNVFAPPAGFTRDFPPFALDGELYIGRGKFEAVSAAVRTAGHSWQGIKLYVFDAPKESGNLYQRLDKAKQHLAKHPNANFAVLAQTPVQNEAHARRFFVGIQRCHQLATQHRKLHQLLCRAIHVCAQIQHQRYFAVLGGQEFRNCRSVHMWQSFQHKTRRCH